MRADADFMVYVAARWPALVQEAVLLGVRPEEAADATTDALSRCRRSWGRTSREENVDALVHDELVVAAGRRASLSAETRQQAARELLVLAPPTLEDFKRRESQHDRAILRRAGIVAVPLLLVGAGAGAWLATHGDDSAPPPSRNALRNAAVSRAENPAADVVWYADGQLHLQHTVLAIEGLREMTRVGSGVVYGDDQGRVVFAAEDGERRVLGREAPDGTMAAADESGWAAWVEEKGGTATIVVKQAETGHVVATTLVDPGSRVVAVDGTDVYYVDLAGPHVYSPASNPQTRPVLPVDLLDVRSRNSVFQVNPGTIEVVQAYFSTVFDLPGVGATLSRDGNLVATRLLGSDSEVALYDTRSGAKLPNGLTEDAVVLAVQPGVGLTVSYILAPDGRTPGRELQLRTCDLTSTLCRIVARIPNTGGDPLLAR